jgi:hypothetical protein
MGELDTSVTYESFTPGEKRKSKLIAAIMLLIGLFAPVMITVFNYGWTTPQISMMSMFWTYYSESYYMSGLYGFSFIDPYAMFSMFPFLLLRMVPVSQIYRYYNGKTTRKRAIIASFVGDALFLISGIPYLLLSFMGMLMLALPFQLIFGLIVLWRSPLPEPTTPWEIASDDSEPKSWWEKSSGSKQKTPTDDNDELW